jgi:hypothetical protein
VLTAASRLNDRDGRNQQPRQVDSEHASPIGEIARIDPAVVRFSAPSAERETKTQAGSIGATLLERAKELVDIPTRQTAALVLDLDEHSLGARANPERDGRPRPGELEGVLQEVSHDRGEDLPVSLDRHALFDRRDGQTDATSVRLQCRSRCDFVDGSYEIVAPLGAGGMGEDDRCITLRQKDVAAAVRGCSIRPGVVGETEIT